jgi:alpha-glucosidase
MQDSKQEQTQPRLEWWKCCPIYQICPRSFQDSDGDGVGDLPGILSRIDHLSWLGVGAVWLSPVYRSPMLDFGYDVSDYTDVDPRCYKTDRNSREQVTNGWSQVRGRSAGERVKGNL